MTGTVYGVVLNDRAELARREAEFSEKPYGRPPLAPVLYIKPRNTWNAGGEVALPDALQAVEAAATLALIFGPTWGIPVAAALAIDVSEPHTSVYRPAIRQRCRDGFLPVGSASPWSADFASLEISTKVDGVEVRSWSLKNLLRSPLDLASELSRFMTLAPGDVLLVGLPDRPPLVRCGQSITVEAAGLASLSTTIVQEKIA